MGRGWRVAVAGVALVGVLAAGGYWYADRELRAAAEAGLREINALYGDWGVPPLTYERLETDVLARTVSVYHLRQAGPVSGVMGPSWRQTVDMTVDRVDIVSHIGGTLDIAYQGLRAASHLSNTPGGSMPMAGLADSVVTVKAGEVTGVRGEAWREQAVRELFGWYDRASGRGVGIQVTVPRMDAEGAPQVIRLKIAEVAMQSGGDGGGEASLTGMTLDGSDGVTGKIGSSSIRFRPTDAIGRLMDLLPRMTAAGRPTPADRTAFQEAVTDYGRAIAGISVAEVDFAVPGKGQRFSFGEAAIDDLTWRGPIFTDFVFHIDDMDIGIPERLSAGQRAFLASVGMKKIDQSVRIGLHYDPDTGTFRLEPFATSSRDMLAVSVEAGLDNFHLPDTVLREGVPESPVARQQVQKQITAALLTAVPTPVSVRVEDRGGLQAIMAFTADRQGTTVERVAERWAGMLERQGGGILGRDNAASLARDVHAFLTGKQVLTIGLKLRQPVALGAMLGVDVARVLEVSSSVE